VIDVSHETTLSASGFLKMLSGRTSLARLKKFAQPSALLSQLTDRLSRILMTFGVGSDLNDTEINSDGSLGIKERLLFYPDRDVKIEFVVPIDQVRLTSLPL